MSSTYTTQLGAGLGMLNDTRLLLDLWSEGISTRELYEAALASGEFPKMSARRLRNFVLECFAPRYLIDDGQPALLLKRLQGSSINGALDQLMYLFTCRANPVLADFVRQVYWPAYAGGQSELTNEESKRFLLSAREQGNTTTYWSETMVKQVSGYLTGCLADFGLLEPGRRQVRRILPFRVDTAAGTILAYDLHFRQIPENLLLTHQDWQLFGLQRSDVIDELKRMALRGRLLVQSAGEAIRIEWHYRTMEALVDDLTAG